MTQTRTQDAARERVQEALARARAGENFEELARSFSDDPATGPRGGDLGEFSRERMLKAFSDAAFALEVGGISDVIETPFGYHIIQRYR